jgi:hypothetical protein
VVTSTTIDKANTAHYIEVDNSTIQGKAMAAANIQALLSKPGITPEEAIEAGIFPLSRNGLYRALQKGDIESFRVGKKFVIPTAPLRRKFGLEDAAQTASCRDGAGDERRSG